MFGYKHQGKNCIWDKLVKSEGSEPPIGSEQPLGPIVIGKIEKIQVPE